MSTIKVDTIATRTGSGNITVSNNASLSGTLAVTGATTTAAITSTGRHDVNFNGSSTQAFKYTDTGGGNLASFGQFYNPSNALIGNIQNAANAGVHVNVGNGSVVFTQTGYTAANALDDYEEGTFTPTVTGSSSAGTVSTSTLHGEYTKIGRIVHFGVYIYFTSTHSGSGAMKMNLPFTAAGGNTGYCGGGTVVYKAGWTGNGPDWMQIQAGNDFGYVRYDTNTGMADMMTHIQNPAQMMMFGHFLV